MNLQTMKVIAALFEQLIPPVIAAYTFVRSEIEQATGKAPVKSIDELLAEANTRFASIKAKADKEIADAQV